VLKIFGFFNGLQNLIKSKMSEEKLWFR